MWPAPVPYEFQCPSKPSFLPYGKSLMTASSQKMLFFLPNFLFVCLFFPFLFFPLSHHISLQTRSWKKHERWSFSYMEKLPSFYISTTKPSPLAVLSICASLLTSSEWMWGGRGFDLLRWFQFWNVEEPDTDFYSEFASVNKAVLFKKND